MHIRALQLAMTCVAGQTLQFDASVDANKSFIPGCKINKSSRSKKT
jgi:hypothetical protein